jgi:hypothetical protein
VFGVGSELITYLPVNKDPPFLDTVPMGMLTGAIEPAVVPVSVMNSLALIGQSEWHGYAHTLYHLSCPDQLSHADYEL